MARTGLVNLAVSPASSSPMGFRRDFMDLRICNSTGYSDIQNAGSGDATAVQSTIRHAECDRGIDS